MDDYAHKRWAIQPKEPSAGCTFKNPAEIPAGQLIEELGLKNTRIGGACVSQLHGNFFVNDAHATAADVLALLQTLNRDAGKTVVMVTHDPKAAAHARRVVHLEKGELLNGK